MSVARYNARTVELRWQQAWDAQRVFAVGSREPHPGCETPAQSADQCAHFHLGDVRRCTMADVVVRYKRVRGIDGQYPMNGHWFRMPTGRATLAGTVLRSLGLSIDWSGETAAPDPRRGGPEAGRQPFDSDEPFDIDPLEIVETYGADATRWFVLSGSPPERDIAWSEPGLRGAWRFVQRLWRLINSAAEFSRGAPAAAPVTRPAPPPFLRRTTHRTLAQISADLEKSRFNICVARIHAFARALEMVVTADSSEAASPDLKFAAREAAEMMVQLFHPMMPHLAEECWAALGHRRLLATQSWPAFDAGLLLEDTVTLPVHVNGRWRADVTVARDARNGDIEMSVVAIDAIARALDGKAPRKVIIVPQRIINVVA